jgi:hypothetical protein
MQITVDMADERINAALGALQISQANAADATKALCELSTRLFLDWLLNEKRFETMSQATEHWVATVEERLFPDEAPNPTKLYNRYALSLPKARYLARLLLARRSAHWRAGARRELLARLREFEADARRAERERPSQEFDCVLTRPAYEEFQVLYEEARVAPVNPNRPIRPPKVVSSFVQEVTVRVRCQVVVALIELLPQQQGD